MKWEYTVVLIATLFFPLILSWNKNLSIWKQTSALRKALVFVCIPFWIWDIIVTARGHWSFNPEFVLGALLFGMPLEEWAFFVVVAFVSIFTWEATKYFMERK